MAGWNLDRRGVIGCLRIVVTGVHAAMDDAAAEKGRGAEAADRPQQGPCPSAHALLPP